MTTYIPSLTLPSSVFSTPAVAVLLPVVGGVAIGVGVGSQSTKDRYMALKQPPFRPPPWLFGPAWTVLYSLMGYASYRAWHTGSLSVNPLTRDLAKQGATLYTIQLGLNFVWMPLFFGLKRPIEAAVDIVTLTGVTSYLTYIWSQVDEVAAWCLVPYIGWLSFATYLNVATGHLNNWNLEYKKADKKA